MRAVIVGVALLALSGSASAQSSIVGTWEGILTSTRNGKSIDIPCHVIYTADGHFSRLCVSANRRKLKGVANLPKDDVFRLWDDLTAQFGTYTIAGNKMTRKIVSEKVPNAEGTEGTLTWRIDKGELVMSADTPEGGAGRYRRAK